MILILKSGLDADALQQLMEELDSRGLCPRLLDEEVEEGRRLVELPESDEARQRPDSTVQAQLAQLPQVERILSFGESFPLAHAAPRRFRFAERFASSRFAQDGHDFADLGAGSFAWIAGPCSVEDPDTVGEIASCVARAGATMLRGGAYKPRTSPYAFQGHGREGLLLLKQVGADFGLPIVTEVLDPRDVDFVAQHADVLQIGARNMQNFTLLREIGRCGRPVLLKRSASGTLDEWLGSAEHLLDAGTTDLALCERGVVGHDTSRRNLLDLSVVPAVRKRCDLPVVVDPSHATGKRSLVTPMAKAAVVAGADAVMVEVHVRPERALSDNAQALLPSELPELSAWLRVLAQLEGRRFLKGPCFRPDGAEASLVERLMQTGPERDGTWPSEDAADCGEASSRKPGNKRSPAN